LPLAAFRAHVGDDAPVGLLHQAFQHAVYHTQNPEPYTPTRHVVSLLRIDLSVDSVVVDGVPPPT